MMQFVSQFTINEYWNVIIIIKFQAEILNIFVLANKMYRTGLAVSAVNYGKF